MNKKWLGLLCVVAATAAWSAEPTVHIGDLPPDYLGRDGAGEKVSISDHRGKVVVVSFFATWCGPCRKEVPSLASLQKAAGQDKLKVIAVDYMEDRSVVKKVRRLFKDYGITFTHDENGRIAAKYGVDGIPHMVIIGADGKIAAEHVGYGEGSIDEVIEDINRIWRETRNSSQTNASSP